MLLTTHAPPPSKDDPSAGTPSAAPSCALSLTLTTLACTALTRDELRYILDPKDVMGEDYPSETFRVLKETHEIPRYGEYRTRRGLVLEAWDRQSH